MASAKLDSKIPLLLRTLKELFRGRGLRHEDIAAALHVSRMTVKRYLSGKGLSLAVLEQLCQLADISLLELSELTTQSVQATTEQLSAAQENALAENQGLAFLLHLLMTGWTPAEIQAELYMADHVLVSFLSRLDRLGFIDLLPGNKVRLRTIRHIHWAHNDRLKRSFDRHLKRHFNKGFDHPDVIWRYRLVKLSHASIVRLQALFEEWSRTIHALGQDDRKLPPEQCCWHGVLLAAQPVDLSSLGEIPSHDPGDHDSSAVPIE
jgi:transcriptional regulator with XRE-family HTH domain